MILKLFSAVFFILVISGNIILAQEQHYKSFSGPEDSAQIIILKTGEVFRNNLSRATIMNAKAVRKLEGRLEQDSLIMALQAKQINVLSEANQNYASLTARMDSIIRIQDIAYDALKNKQKETSDLVTASNNNTSEALSLAKKQRIFSYVSSTLTGCVAGGLVAGKSGDRFNALGAFGGAVIGLLVNFIIQKL